MRLLFVTKGSEKIGLGHIVRSSTLAEKAAKNGDRVTFLAIGSPLIKNLITDKSFSPVYLKQEKDLFRQDLASYDAIIFDLLDLENESFSFFSDKSKITVSISPIFNQNNKVNLFFSRTKYVDGQIEAENLEKYCGLDYTILKEGCIQVNTNDYVNNLKKENVHVAISMGGGDAQNKTLEFLRQVKEIITPTTFWVLLGEGYKHSYDKLIAEINLDRRHEIVLAKTNRSMWHIVNNCSLIVLPGGITTYEAVHCGIPSINFLYDLNNSYLIEELVENKACINAGGIDSQNISKFPIIVNQLFQNKEELAEMHRKSLSLIDNKGCDRILRIIRNSL